MYKYSKQEKFAKKKLFLSFGVTFLKEVCIRELE